MAHRLRTSLSSNGARVDLDGMVGADACCSTDGETQDRGRPGTAMTFDVVPAEGDTWQVDARPLHRRRPHATSTRRWAAASSSIQTAVTGRARIGAGAWQNFNFNPSV